MYVCSACITGGRTVGIVSKCIESFVILVCIVSVCTIRIGSICSIRFAIP